MKQKLRLGKFRWRVLRRELKNGFISESLWDKWIGWKLTFHPAALKRAWTTASCDRSCINNDKGSANIMAYILVTAANLKHDPLLSCFVSCRYTKPAPMFLDRNFRRLAKVSNYMPPFGFKTQGTTAVLQCYVPSTLGALKAISALRLTQSNLYLIWIAIKHLLFIFFLWLETSR